MVTQLMALVLLFFKSIAYPRFGLSKEFEMRFTATGSNIPNELIDAQKRGELLFFCGAGVSVSVNKQFDRTFSALF
ncbi:hypothetical protein ACNJ69_10940 [Acinetobacter soli]|uniref:hypothetical protein n=1 Tax=Acinetobacter soli TaxID=487316 RepID=UPI003B9E36F3